MFSFYAYFWNNDVYIGKRKYAANEILTAYLNRPHSLDDGHIADLLDVLDLAKDQLVVSDDMKYDNYYNYNTNVYRVRDRIAYLHQCLEKLPPYGWILNQNYKNIDDLLNEYQWFFHDGFDDYDPLITPDLVTPYGFGVEDQRGICRFRLTKFEPEDSERLGDLDLDMKLNLEEMNQAIVSFLDAHIQLLQTIRDVPGVFGAFLEDLHAKGSYPDESSIANSFAKHKQVREFPCQLRSFGYRVLQDETGDPRLCDEILFADLGSFLFYDLFNGLRKNYLPNRCKNCGNYFLIRAGKYINYCDRPLSDEPDKTCRDIGARRRYDDKCKNDPVWQTYNRAYKAHYARYLKKKMTAAEFESWSRYASELRDKAISEELAYEEYYQEIRK